jgi:hypothetical protein
MFKASNIHYEMADRVQGVNCGGIGAMHLMVQRLGLWLVRVFQRLTPPSTPITRWPGQRMCQV